MSAEGFLGSGSMVWFTLSQQRDGESTGRAPKRRCATPGSLQPSESFHSVSFHNSSIRNFSGFFETNSTPKSLIEQTTRMTLN